MLLYVRAHALGNSFCVCLCVCSLVFVRMVVCPYAWQPKSLWYFLSVLLDRWSPRPEKPSRAPPPQHATPAGVSHSVKRANIDRIRPRACMPSPILRFSAKMIPWVEPGQRPPAPSSTRLVPDLNLASAAKSRGRSEQTSFPPHESAKTLRWY